MILLTFVGTGKYYPVTYTWKGRSCNTALASEAVVTLLPEPEGEAFTEAIVGLTTKARGTSNYTDIQTGLRGAGLKVRPADIPDGSSEEELWEIFSRLAEAVPKNARVVLDITHALRHIPIIGMALATYLHEAKHATVCDIVYGAFELKNTEAGTCPLISMAPFLNMTSWAIAARYLSTSGDTRPLADVMGGAGGTEKQLSSELENLSLALALNRPAEVAAHSKRVVGYIDRMATVETPGAGPFRSIHGRVRETYASLQAADVSGQLNLIEWYVERGRYIQACMLAGEWLINLVAEQNGVRGTSRSERERISAAIYQVAEQNTQSDLADGEADAKNDPDAESNEETLQPLEVEPNIAAVWRDLGDLRNDIAHCGFRESPRKMKTIANQAGLLSQQLRGLRESTVAHDESPEGAK